MDFGASSYRRYLNGDEGALNDLVGEYGDSLVRFAYSYLGDTSAAEDVMEETFATLIVKRKPFAENAKFKTFLFKIARNKCMDVLRRRKRYTPLNEDVLHFGDLESDAILSDEHRMVRENMAALSENYRQVLELIYFEEFSEDDVCKILHKSKKQIYNLLYRAKASLKEILIKAGFDHENN